jgi:hypothetical protein
LKIRIEVTKQDIMTGSYCDPWRCPVANATRRACSEAGLTRTLVSAMQPKLTFYHGEVRPGNDVKFDKDDTNIVLQLDQPTEVSNWIRTFDNCMRLNMQPISFEIEIPDEVVPKLKG